MIQQLCGLHTIAPRITCVSAAAASLLALPSSVVTQGLEQEPTTAASQIRDGATILLDEPHLHILHQHFSVLAQVIPPGNTDLLSPSVLWLTYMAHEKTEQAELIADTSQGGSVVQPAEHAQSQLPPLPEGAS